LILNHFRENSQNIYKQREHILVMGLKDIDDFEEDEIETPRKKKRKLFTIPKKFKIWVVLILIGIIIGLVAGHFYLEPILNEAGVNACNQCFTAREILTKESDCLYNYISDAKMVVDGCST